MKKLTVQVEKLYHSFGKEHIIILVKSKVYHTRVQLYQTSTKLTYEQHVNSPEDQKGSLITGHKVKQSTVVSYLPVIC